MLEVFEKLDKVTQEADEEKFKRFKLYAMNVNQRRLEYKGQMQKLMGAPDSDSEIASVSTSELNILRDKASRYDKNRESQKKSMEKKRQREKDIKFGVKAV